MTGQRPAQWPVVIAVLHWGTAVLTLATAAYAIYLLSPPDWSQPYIDRYYAGIGLHKLGGLAVLALVVCWGCLRLGTPRPPMVAQGTMGGVVLAVHGLLFTLAILLPLSGYAMDGFNGNALSFPGGLTIPPFLPPSNSASIALSYPHKWGGYALLALVALHVAGALRHAFGEGQPNALLAMLPRPTPRK